MSRCRSRDSPPPSTNTRIPVHARPRDCWVGDDLRYPAKPDGGRQVNVGRHQDRHRSQARQCGDRDERAGPGLHEHPDVGALPHTDVDQAADHVVDPSIDGLEGVHSSVEQQALAIGQIAGLLGHDAAERHPGVVIDLSQARQPRQGAIGLDSQCAGGLVGRHQRVGRRPGHGERHRGRGRGAVRYPELGETPVSSRTAG